MSLPAPQVHGALVVAWADAGSGSRALFAIGIRRGLMPMGFPASWVPNVRQMELLRRLEQIALRHDGVTAVHDFGLVALQLRGLWVPRGLGPQSRSRGRLVLTRDDVRRSPGRLGVQPWLADFLRAGLKRHYPRPTNPWIIAGDSNLSGTLDQAS
jgi:hypothetical protein